MTHELPVEVSVFTGHGLKDHVLTRYDLPDPVQCDFFGRGENDTYLVRASSTRYYLRVYSKWRKKPEIQAELEMLNNLHRAQLPISHPLPRKDGRLLTRIAAPEGERYACLFSNAEGEAVSMDAEHSHAYGRLVARVHACLDELPTDPRRFHLDLDHLIHEPLAHIRHWIGGQSKAYQYLSRVGQELSRWIDTRLSKEKPIYGSCHGDHHGANVHTDQNGRLTLFDFDCYGYGWRAYDMAVFLWSHHNATGWEPQDLEETKQRWDSFVRGYETVRALTPSELEATNVFVPVRHLWMLGNAVKKVDSLGHNRITRGHLHQNIKFIGQCVRNYELLD